MSGLILCGCASVQTDCEWSKVQEIIPIDEEIFWIESEEDAVSVDAMIQNALQNPLSQEEVIGIGLINNKELQSTFEEIGIGKADLIQAGLYTNPSLSVLLRFPFSGSGTNIESNGLFNINDLWLVPLRKKAAEFAMKATILEVANKVLMTRREIKIAFNKVYFKTMLVKETESYYNEMKELSGEAQNRVESGFVMEMDAKAVAIMFQQACILKNKNQSELRIAKAELSQLMGICNSEFRLRENVELNVNCEIGLEEAFGIACMRRLDLQMAQMQIKEQERTYELNKRRVFKDVKAGYAFERDLNGANLFGPAFDLQVPLFDQNQAQIAKSRYMLRRAEKKRQALADQVQINIKANIARLEQLREKNTIYKDNILPLQDEIINFSERENELMQLNRFTFIETRKNRALLKIEYLESQLEIQNEIAQLEYNLGGSLSTK